MKNLNSDLKELGKIAKNIGKTIKSRLSDERKVKYIIDLLGLFYKKLYFSDLDSSDFRVKILINQINKIDDIRNLAYVIESTPAIKVMDYTILERAVEHLRNASSNNADYLTDGITLEEARVILDWTVNNTRINLSISSIDVMNDSIMGSCGFCQSSTLLPLERIGLPTTINNSRKTFDAIAHAFGTVIIPIKENSVATYKQFLIDCSYRQFFKTIGCHEGRYYEKDERFTGKVAPDPGYFMLQDERKISFAQELLKNGYIELTEENAKLYSDPFVLSFCGLEYLDKTSDLKNLNLLTSGSEYINRINSITEEHDYTIEDFNAGQYNIEFPFGSDLTK